MIYSIEFSEKALKQIKKLERDDQLRISATLERIRIRPEVHLKRLVASKYYSIRVGKIRLILDFQKDRFVIMVVVVDNRGRVYQNLKNL